MRCVYAACLFLLFFTQLLSVANWVKCLAILISVLCAAYGSGARVALSPTADSEPRLNMAASAAVAAKSAMELIEDMKQQMLAMQTD